MSFITNFLKKNSHKKALEKAEAELEEFLRTVPDTGPLNLAIRSLRVALQSERPATERVDEALSTTALRSVELLGRHATHAKKRWHLPSFVWASLLSGLDGRQRTADFDKQQPLKVLFRADLSVPVNQAHRGSPVVREQVCFSIKALIEHGHVQLDVGAAVGLGEIVFSALDDIDTRESSLKASELPTLHAAFLASSALFPPIMTADEATAATAVETDDTSNNSTSSSSNMMSRAASSNNNNSSNSNNSNFAISNATWSSLSLSTLMCVSSAWARLSHIEDAELPFCNAAFTSRCFICYDKLLPLLERLLSDESADEDASITLPVQRREQAARAVTILSFLHRVFLATSANDVWGAGASESTFRMEQFTRFVVQRLRKLIKSNLHQQQCKQQQQQYVDPNKSDIKNDDEQERKPSAMTITTINSSGSGDRSFAPWSMHCIVECINFLSAAMYLSPLAFGRLVDNAKLLQTLTTELRSWALDTECFSIVELPSFFLPRNRAASEEQSIAAAKVRASFSEDAIVSPASTGAAAAAAVAAPTFSPVNDGDFASTRVRQSKHVNGSGSTFCPPVFTCTEDLVLATVRFRISYMRTLCGLHESDELKQFMSVVAPKSDSSEPLLQEAFLKRFTALLADCVLNAWSAPAEVQRLNAADAIALLTVNALVSVARQRTATATERDLALASMTPQRIHVLFPHRIVSDDGARAQLGQLVELVTALTVEAEQGTTTVRVATVSNILLTILSDMLRALNAEVTSGRGERFGSVLGLTCAVAEAMRMCEMVTCSAFLETQGVAALCACTKLLCECVEATAAAEESGNGKDNNNNSNNMNSSGSASMTMTIRTTLSGPLNLLKMCAMSPLCLQMSQEDAVMLTDLLVYPICEKDILEVVTNLISRFHAIPIAMQTDGASAAAANSPSTGTTGGATSSFSSTAALSAIWQAMTRLSRVGSPHERLWIKLCRAMMDALSQHPTAGANRESLLMRLCCIDNSEVNIRAVRRARGMSVAVASPQTPASAPRAPGGMPFAFVTVLMHMAGQPWESIRGVEARRAVLDLFIAFTAVPFRTLFSAWDGALPWDWIVSNLLPFSATNGGSNNINDNYSSSASADEQEEAEMCSFALSLLQVAIPHDQALAHKESALATSTVYLPELHSALLKHLHLSSERSRLALAALKAVLLRSFLLCLASPEVRWILSSSGTQLMKLLQQLIVSRPAPGDTSFFEDVQQQQQQQQQQQTPASTTTKSETTNNNNNNNNNNNKSSATGASLSYDIIFKPQPRHSAQSLAISMCGLLLSEHAPAHVLRSLLRSIRNDALATAADLSEFAGSGSAANNSPLPTNLASPFTPVSAFNGDAAAAAAQRTLFTGGADNNNSSGDSTNNNNGNQQYLDVATRNMLIATLLKTAIDWGDGSSSRPALLPKASLLFQAKSVASYLRMQLAPVNQSTTLLGSGSATVPPFWFSLRFCLASHSAQQLSRPSVLVTIRHRKINARLSLFVEPASAEGKISESKMALFDDAADLRIGFVAHVECGNNSSITSNNNNNNNTAGGGAAGTKTIRQVSLGVFRPLSWFHLTCAVASGRIRVFMKGEVVLDCSGVELPNFFETQWDLIVGSRSVEQDAQLLARPCAPFCGQIQHFLLGMCFFEPAQAKLIYNLKGADPVFAGKAAAAAAAAAAQQQHQQAAAATSGATTAGGNKSTGAGAAGAGSPGVASSSSGADAAGAAAAAAAAAAAVKRPDDELLRSILVCLDANRNYGLPLLPRFSRHEVGRLPLQPTTTWSWTESVPFTFVVADNVLVRSTQRPVATLVQMMDSFVRSVAAPMVRCSLWGYNNNNNNGAASPSVLSRMIEHEQRIRASSLVSVLDLIYSALCIAEVRSHVVYSPESVAEVGAIVASALCHACDTSSPFRSGKDSLAIPAKLSALLRVLYGRSQPRPDVLVRLTSTWLSPAVWSNASPIVVTAVLKELTSLPMPSLSMMMMSGQQQQPGQPQQHQQQQQQQQHQNTMPAEALWLVPSWLMWALEKCNECDQTTQASTAAVTQDEALNNSKCRAAAYDAFATSIHGPQGCRPFDATTIHHTLNEILAWAERCAPPLRPMNVSWMHSNNNIANSSSTTQQSGRTSEAVTAENTVSGAAKETTAASAAAAAAASSAAAGLNASFSSSFAALPPKAFPSLQSWSWNTARQFLVSITRILTFQYQRSTTQSLQPQSPLNPPPQHHPHQQIAALWRFVLPASGLLALRLTAFDELRHEATLLLVAFVCYSSSFLRLFTISGEDELGNTTSSASAANNNNNNSEVSLEALNQFFAPFVFDEHFCFSLLCGIRGHFSAPPLSSNAVVAAATASADVARGGSSNNNNNNNNSEDSAPTHHGEILMAFARLQHHTTAAAASFSHALRGHEKFIARVLLQMIIAHRPNSSSSAALLARRKSNTVAIPIALSATAPPSSLPGSTPGKSPQLPQQQHHHHACVSSPLSPQPQQPFGGDHVPRDVDPAPGDPAFSPTVLASLSTRNAPPSFASPYSSLLAQAADPMSSSPSNNNSPAQLHLLHQHASAAAAAAAAAATLRAPIVFLSSWIDEDASQQRAVLLSQLPTDVLIRAFLAALAAQVSDKEIEELVICFARIMSVVTLRAAVAPQSQQQQSQSDGINNNIGGRGGSYQQRQFSVESRLMEIGDALIKDARTSSESWTGSFAIGSPQVTASAAAAAAAARTTYSSSSPSALNTVGRAILVECLSHMVVELKSLLNTPTPDLVMLSRARSVLIYVDSLCCGASVERLRANSVAGSAMSRSALTNNNNSNSNNNWASGFVEVETMPQSSPFAQVVSLGDSFSNYGAAMAGGRGGMDTGDDKVIQLTVLCINVVAAFPAIVELQLTAPSDAHPQGIAESHVLSIVLRLLRFTLDGSGRGIGDPSFRSDALTAFGRICTDVDTRLNEAKVEAASRSIFSNPFKKNKGPTAAMLMRAKFGQAAIEVVNAAKSKLALRLKHEESSSSGANSNNNSNNSNSQSKALAAYDNAVSKIRTTVLGNPQETTVTGITPEAAVEAMLHSHVTRSSVIDDTHERRAAAAVLKATALSHFEEAASSADDDSYSALRGAVSRMPEWLLLRQHCDDMLAALWSFASRRFWTCTMRGHFTETPLNITSLNGMVAAMQDQTSSGNGGNPSAEIVMRHMSHFEHYFGFGISPELQYGGALLPIKSVPISEVQQDIPTIGGPPTQGLVRGIATSSAFLRLPSRQSYIYAALQSGRQSDQQQSPKPAVAAPKPRRKKKGAAVHNPASALDPSSNTLDEDGAAAAAALAATLVVGGSESTASAAPTDTDTVDSRQDSRHETTGGEDHDADDTEYEEEAEDEGGGHSHHHQHDLHNHRHQPHSPGDEPETPGFGAASDDMSPSRHSGAINASTANSSRSFSATTASSSASMMMRSTLLYSSTTARSKSSSSGGGAGAGGISSTSSSSSLLSSMAARSTALFTSGGGVAPSMASIADERIVESWPCELPFLMQCRSAVLKVTTHRVLIELDVVNRSHNPPVSSDAQEFLPVPPSHIVLPLGSIKVLNAQRRFRMRYTAVIFEMSDLVQLMVCFKTMAHHDHFVSVFRQVRNRRKRDPCRILNQATRASDKSKIRDAWVNGEMNNFDYLMQLNMLGHRTALDCSQYPVFPWIVADYTSSKLDLEADATFRRLDLPVGLQGDTERREEELTTRFRDLEDLGDVPFHFFTHYSTVAVVLFYLVRLEPYTAGHVVLQGGRFDHADRMFHSVATSWTGVSQSHQDVKELIPEFYCMSSFLRNTSGVPFGAKQNMARMNHVQLPPWAEGSPWMFVARLREALECEYVTGRLNYWIDLIFGHRQRGPAAVESCNLYHPDTYESEEITDDTNDASDDVRRQVIDTLDNIGQCPALVFRKEHLMSKMKQFSRKTPLARSSEMVVKEINVPFSAALPSSSSSSSSANLPTGLSASSGASHAVLCSVFVLEKSVVVFDSAGVPHLFEIQHASSPVDRPTVSNNDGPQNAASAAASAVVGGAANLFSALINADATVDLKLQTDVNGIAAIHTSVNQAGGMICAPLSPIAPAELLYAGRQADRAVSLSQTLVRRSEREIMPLAVTRPGCVGVLATSDERQIYAVVPDDRSCVLIGLRSRYRTRLTHHSEAITCLHVSRDNRFLVTGGADCIACVYAVDDLTGTTRDGIVQVSCIATLQSHAAAITAVFVSSELDLVVTADAEGVVQMHTLRRSRHCPGPHRVIYFPPAMSNNNNSASVSAADSVTFAAGSSSASSALLPSRTDVLAVLVLEKAYLPSVLVVLAHSPCTIYQLSLEGQLLKQFELGTDCRFSHFCGTADPRYFLVSVTSAFGVGNMAAFDEVGSALQCRSTIDMSLVQNVLPHHHHQHHHGQPTAAMNQHHLLPAILAVSAHPSNPQIAVAACANGKMMLIGAETKSK